ncbi:hypothetical protein ACU4HD_43735 [Cupriavidus basilensis]
MFDTPCEWRQGIGQHRAAQGLRHMRVCGVGQPCALSGGIEQQPARRIAQREAVGFCRGLYGMRFATRFVGRAAYGKR